MDIARIESNTLKLNKEQFDLVEKIDDIIKDKIIHTVAINTAGKPKNNTEIVFSKPDTAIFLLMQID